MHDRSVTNHPHSCPLLSLSVVFFAVDRSVQSAEVDVIQVIYLKCVSLSVEIQVD